MSKFLKDLYLKNLTLSESAIEEINTEIENVINTANKGVGPLSINYLILKYIIRFDGQGYTMYDYEEFKSYFKKAKKVERVLFAAYSIDSFNAITGKCVNLNFDLNDLNNCYLGVTDDDKNWTNSIFNDLKQILDKHKNLYWLIRNSWTAFFVQALGALGAFSISLWAANKIYKKFDIENSLVFYFIAILLLLGNLWTPVYQSILSFINSVWPNIKFKPKKRSAVFQWFILMIATYFSYKVFDFLLGIIKTKLIK
ncbi:MAG: hypothetical protein KAI72_07545 [Candidatus Pacebacteria bacterium]|nr:hypothetical protein [Candidatus Paceibacterota bacterium]